MNYYEHHLGDWAAATGHLTWDEDMAYTRLLRAYYHAERAIPQGQQYRLAKASTPVQRKAVDAVLAEFFVLTDGSFHQKRADEEIGRYQDKQRKAKASANARWSHTERNANASSNAMRTHMPTHSEGNAHQTPDTRHQSPEEEKSVGATAAVVLELKPSASRGSRLPQDWTIPDEWIAEGEKVRADAGLSPINLRLESGRFRDHWVSKAGRDGVKLDWLATWRNWCRNARGSPIPASVSSHLGLSTKNYREGLDANGRPL